MSRSQRLALLGAFVVSGGLALVYQVTWARMLYPVFGMHLPAISVVVATFLGGLGVGALLIGQRVDRAALPFRLYGILEMSIGVYAVCLPSLTRFLSPVYATLSPLDAPPALDHVVRVVGVFVLLAVPCLLMGATFPAFARGYLRSAPRMSRDLGLLYALNTVGAAAGCLLAGTVLMQSPVSGIVYGTACGNMLLGLLFYMLAPRLTRGESPLPESQTAATALQDVSLPGQANVILTITLLTGFLSLSFEILWTRALIPVIGATYVSFALILSSMLIGITLGTALYNWRLHRINPSRLLVILSTLLLLVSLGSFLGVFHLAKALPEIRALLPISGESAAQLFPPFLLCFLAFLPSSMIFGAIFPLCLGLYTRAVDHVGTDVGRVYAVNTVGSVTGVLMTGLVIIEWLGSSRTLVLLLMVGLVTIWVSLRLSTADARRLTFAASTLAVVGIAVILLFPRDLFFAHQRAELKAQIPATAKIVFQAEDAKSMTTIAELQSSFQYVDERGPKKARHRWTLHSNRSYVGGTRIYLWNIVGGYLAGLLPPNPKSVLIIGFGSGRQTATMAGLSHIEKIDVVEISQLNFAASDYYYVDSERLFRDPRIRLFEGDGRNHLLRSRETYDVIIVDVGGLTPNSSTFFYTREFLEICRARLNQNGYLFTWTSAAAMLEPQGWMYQHTFRSVFSDASVWYGTRERTSFAWPWIVGVKGKMAIDYVTLRRRWEALTALQKTELRISGIESPEDLLSLYASALDREVPEPIARARDLTDDHPYHRVAWSRAESSVSGDLEGLTHIESSFRHFVDARAAPDVRNQPASSRLVMRQSHAEFAKTVSRRMIPALVDVLRRSLTTQQNAAEMLERFEERLPEAGGSLENSKPDRTSPVAAALRALVERPDRRKSDSSGTP